MGSHILDIQIPKSLKLPPSRTDLAAADMDNKQRMNYRVGWHGLEGSMEDMAYAPLVLGCPPRSWAGGWMKNSVSSKANLHYSSINK